LTGYKPTPRRLLLDLEQLAEFIQAAPCAG
jgi:hypothetical protein